MKNAHVDIVILGGGIAGLWLLSRLRQQGRAAILLETNALGSGQTGKAQGIIHGGMKYALQGLLTPAAKAISAMPTLWAECLAGKGEIDLKRATLFSQYQYLWSTGSLSSNLTTFFASKVLQGKISSLSKENFPEIFRHAQFKGHIYRLEEIVIDANSVVRELYTQNREAIFKIDPLDDSQIQLDATGKISTLNIKAANTEITALSAQKYIFTAGEGNELLLKKLNNASIAMQRRPLHMVFMKADGLYPLYAHCMGHNAVPRITITTHPTQDGKSVWYLGGQIAEEGVSRNSAQQIQSAQQELAELFPWLNFANAQWTSFFIDRAEPLQADGKRPDQAFVKNLGNVMVAWPTKLALAPQLSADILAQLSAENIQTTTPNLQALQAWPQPVIATPIWDEK